jgi:hypothetical protein
MKKYLVRYNHIYPSGLVIEDTHTYTAESELNAIVAFDKWRIRNGIKAELTHITEYK